MIAIQAAPTGTSASATRTGIRAVATTAVAAALTSMATVTRVALPSRARSRGMISAPTTAPIPTPTIVVAANALRFGDELNPGSLRDGGSYGVITVTDGECQFGWRRVPEF